MRGNRAGETNLVIKGVNVAAHFEHASGLGQAARATVRALEAAGIDVVLNDAEGSWTTVDNAIASRLSNPHPVNLIHLNPQSVSGFVHSVGSDYRKGKYNIGMWLWEASRFPPEWHSTFDYFDEIWTPSSFCLDAISRVSPIPVVRIPLCVEPAAPESGRADFDLPENVFVFLFVFNFVSSFERKNPLAVIEAFLQAFGKEDTRVLLVIKSTHGSGNPHSYKRMIEACAGARNIRIGDTVMERNQVEALIASCDCYVSLHRSEGFGLTMAEAMAYGKPVIATHYSANMDFMTVSNSLPVGFEMRSMENADYIHYLDAGDWAEPDVRHAAELMKNVVNDPQHASAIGERGQHDIRRTLSAEAVGRLISERLEHIGARLADKTGDSAGETTAREVRVAEAYAAALATKIDWMENSRFWRLRDKYHRLRQRLLPRKRR